jgi:pimeloyl-ACP methyl ester carboxylesterase
MSRASANAVELEYETFGSRDNPALILIMGVGAQMIRWPDAFCRSLADTGHYVIRFDNRDIGRSTWLDELEIPDVKKMIEAALAGNKPTSPYTLEDMADDTMALLTALGREKAHVVGASMGGMIAQLCAAGYPGRVLSLTSIMSTSGRRDLPQGKPEAMQALMTPPADINSRESVIAHDIKVLQLISGDGFPMSEARARELAESSYERGYHPAGAARQFAAIITNGSRSRQLAGIRAPSLVIHGADDPLMPPAAGEDTAALIPGAALRIIDGMGHDLASEVVPEVVQLISRHCASN